MYRLKIHSCILHNIKFNLFIPIFRIKYVQLEYSLVQLYVKKFIFRKLNMFYSFCTYLFTFPLFINNSMLLLKNLRIKSSMIKFANLENENTRDEVKNKNKKNTIRYSHTYVCDCKNNAFFRSKREDFLLYMFVCLF